MEPSPMMNRRNLLGLSAGALAFAGAGTARAAAAPTAKRPQPPYRVWFQPRQFHRDMSLYRHMTIDASGWIDPALCELTGRSGLRWVYGTQNPYAESPEYWTTELAPPARTSSHLGEQFVGPGVAIDEWVPPQRPGVEQYLTDGLRAAKEADPNLFLCVWYTDLRPPLIELIKDGTVDLAIVEGYTHTPERFGPGAYLAWTTCLRRCDAAAEANTLDKTIFSFGHITDEPHIHGQRLSPEQLTERAEEIKDRYPAMPGVAFYQSDSPDTPELRALVQHCDRLSGRLWPDAPAEKAPAE
ncbi:hypothetical protein [Alienimonas californiensis]|nr:hypothetical protein [Alienimonas californiensis]